MQADSLSPREVANYLHWLFALGFGNLLLILVLALRLRKKADK
ncbi:MAG TPA: hypothetical protein VGR55_01350 [Candidatus Acidoferrum sp.]|nr:hypothetical protein [Candidatus Acidoferrum sp.]